MQTFDEAFDKFVKDNWPGFFQKEAFFNFDDACLFEHIKTAFRAGWDAKHEQE